ncbi:hypothetical protein O5D80_001516 [Batrachochytrium dendrobatidis]|nr:hypothetical protein O5D80_001516 [Batrachochytrium dendrobatidis]
MSKMKLSIAVLASVLVACSVTTANPILPSLTTNAEYSTSTGIPSSTTNAEYSTSTDIPSSTASTEFSPSPTPNESGIGLHGLVLLSVKVKDMLDEYLKKRNNYSKQKESCDLIGSRFLEQQKLVKNLEKKVRNFKLRLESSDGSPRHGRNSKMEGREVNLESQYSKYLKLERQKEKCDLESGRLKDELELIKILFVELVFGGPYDLDSFEDQFLLILSHPTVDYYLENSCDKERPSSEMPSKSGSNKWKSSKLVDRFKSFFG